MSDGRRLQRPGTPAAEQEKDAGGPTNAGNSVEADRAWAQNRIANFFRGPRVMRKATGDTAADDGNGRDADVSQPGEPAENEAHAVADHVTDQLHGGDGKGGVDHATKEAAPQIAAKRASGTISLAKDDKKTDDKKPQRDMTMLGAKGTQCTSKTMWKGKGKERIDVENPNPGQRPGQIHYQDNDNNKYLYDPATKAFKGAPKAVNEKLKDPQFAAGIAKAMALLGEKP